MKPNHPLLLSGFILLNILGLLRSEFRSEVAVDFPRPTSVYFESPFSHHSALLLTQEMSGSYLFQQAIPRSFLYLGTAIPPDGAWLSVLANGTLIQYRDWFRGVHDDRPDRIFLKNRSLRI
jgi:hypothetical protein